jgi:hypothetical protein
MNDSDFHLPNEHQLSELARFGRFHYDPAKKAGVMLRARVIRLESGGQLSVWSKTQFPSKKPATVHSPLRSRTE